MNRLSAIRIPRGLITFMVIGVVLFASVPFSTAFAVTNPSASSDTETDAEKKCREDMATYSMQNITGLTPPSCAKLLCSTGSNVASTGGSSAVSLSASDPKLKQIYTLLVQSGQFNAVQASAVMGNMYAESGFNSGAVESNSIGYGLVQWSFGRRTSLENAAKAQGVAASDVAFQINFLVGEYNGSYKGTLASTVFGDSGNTDVGAATEAWMDKFEVPFNKPPSADYPKLLTKRIPAAQQIYGFFKDSVPITASTSSTTVSTVSSSTSNCATSSTSNAVVAGSIIKTAIGLALPAPVADGKTEKSDASEAYQKVHDQVNPTVQFSDCGGFIATVMISSGVDPDYPKVNVTTQVDYVKSHPAKYQIIDKPTTADLQPGDILLSNQAGHTTLYLGNGGDNTTNYPAADASLGQRVPSLRDISNSTWMIANGAIIARYIAS